MSLPRCWKSDKACFTTPKQARESLVGQLKSKRMRAYWCTHCHYYHLTKQKPVELKKKGHTRGRYPNRFRSGDSD